MTNFSMNFSQLSFIVTDDCNFRCSYCPQTRGKKYMKLSTIKKTVPFFYPYLEKGAYIGFFGGEPLLAFDTVKYIVSLVREIDSSKKESKMLNYSLTTNGSLVTGKVLEFLNGHGFFVLLSFDGSVQDYSREPGSAGPVGTLIHRLLEGSFPNITFSINSVFSPATINLFSESLQYIVETGAPDIQFNFALDQPWDDAALEALENQLARLTVFLLSHYKEKKNIPVTNFSAPLSKQPPLKRRNTFSCGAGSERMAVTPNETLLGCSVFHDYLKNRTESADFDTYSFGSVDDFIKNHETIYPRVLKNYSILRQDCFYTDERHCYLCGEVTSCNVCPVGVVYATAGIGKIPRWVCHIERIRAKAKKSFLEMIDRINIIR